MEFLVPPKFDGRKVFRTFNQVIHTFRNVIRKISINKLRVVQFPYPRSSGMQIIQTNRKVNNIMIRETKRLYFAIRQKKGVSETKNLSNLEPIEKSELNQVHCREQGCKRCQASTKLNANRKSERYLAHDKLSPTLSN